MRIILASGSPRRAELLSRIGLDFEVIKPECEEHSEQKDPGLYVEELSKTKADHVFSQIQDPNAFIIASDTIVWFEDKILEKPKDNDHALEMLSSMVGKKHQVYTGVCCLYKGESLCFHEITNVEFQNMNNRFLKYYISTREPADKAGAYGIQGLGQVLVRKIEGNFANVMGFPTSRFFNEVQKWLGDKNPILIPTT